MHSEIVRDENGNRRMTPETQFVICEHGAYRGHSDVSGYGDEYRDKGRVQVAGVNIVELQAPGIDVYVRNILRSAVLQCAGNPRYGAEVSESRKRIAKLQRQEAAAEDRQQQMLNRKKKAVA